MLKNTIFMCLFLIGCLPLAAQQNGSPAPTPNAPLTDKAQIEYEKKIAEIQEKNRQIAENNDRIQKFLFEGQQAFAAKNYELALAKFDEAINLDPDFWGTAPVLLTNKAIVLRILGVEKYNAAAKKYWNPAGESHSYFYDAVQALKRAMKIYDENPPPTGEQEKISYEKSRFKTLAELAECYKLLVLTDKTKTFEAVEAFENYIKVETDAAKKEKAERELRKLKSSAGK